MAEGATRKGDAVDSQAISWIVVRALIGACTTPQELSAVIEVLEKRHSRAELVQILRRIVRLDRVDDSAVSAKHHVVRRVDPSEERVVFEMVPRRTGDKHEDLANKLMQVFRDTLKWTVAETADWFKHNTLVTLAGRGSLREMIAKSLMRMTAQEKDELLKRVVALVDNDAVLAKEVESWWEEFNKRRF